MSGRACIRGCMRRGAHFAACPTFGLLTGDCDGCAPAEARQGALICARCYSRLRRMLEAAPDLVALIRSTADPLKAAVYDREIVSGGAQGETLAPVAADLIDASDNIIEFLSWWADGVGVKLRPGADAEEAHDVALGYVRDIEASFDDWANDLDGIVRIWAEVFAIPSPVTNESRWSIARALARWPIEERSYWAAQPCPEPTCRLRTVKVTPPRRAGARARYGCAECGWQRDDDDDGGLWLSAFSRQGGAA